MLKKTIIFLSLLLILQANLAQAEYLRSFRVPNSVGDYWGAGAWHLICRQDSFTDAKHCMIHNQISTSASSVSDFAVMVEENGNLIAPVGPPSRHMPGTQQLIRVDQSQPVAIDAEAFFQLNKEHQSLYQALITGKEAKTRWYSYPDGEVQDQTISLFGFEQAITKAKEILNNQVHYTLADANFELPNLGTQLGTRKAQVNLCSGTNQGQFLIQRAESDLANYPNLLSLFQKSVANAPSLINYGMNQTQCAATTAEAKDYVDRIHQMALSLDKAH